MEKPREISNRNNIILLIIGIVLILVAGGALLCKRIIMQENSGMDKNLLWVLFSIGLFIIVVAIMLRILNNQTNDYLKNLPYSFDYEKELSTYLIVGKEKVKKKNGAENYKNYSEWKEHVCEQRKTGDINIDNYYHFMIRMFRSRKVYAKLVMSLVMPIEIAFLSIIFGNNAYNYNIYEIVVTIIILSIFFTIND